MLKKIFLILLAMIMCFSLFACNRQNDPIDSESQDENTDIPAKVAPKVKRYDWDITTIEIDGTQYYDYIIEVVSSELYSFPLDKAVLFQDSNGVIQDINDVYDDLIISSYCINKGVGGKTEYIINIKSPKMIDLQKVRIDFIGVKSYKQGVEWTDFDDCAEKYEMDDIWAVYLPSSGNKTSSKDIVYGQPSRFNEHFYIGSDNLRLYYLKADDSYFISDNTLWKKIQVIGINTNEFENFFDDTSSFYCFELNENIKTINDLSTLVYVDNYQVISKLEGDIIYLGIKPLDTNAKIEDNMPAGGIVLDYSATTISENMEIEETAINRAFILIYKTQVESSND